MPMMHDYQSLDVVQELGNNRQFIKFSLMETRWRSVDEAADYLRWAATELEKLK
jgi:lysine/ornithine N-monooxygenase